MGKPVCPIITGNPRYFGLTQIEWAAALFIFFFVNLLPAPIRYIGYLIWLIAVIIYPRIIRKLEENFISVIIVSMKIPSTIIGHYRKSVPQAGETGDKDA